MYRNFRINVITRVSIIIGLSILFAFVITEREMFFAPVVTAIALIIASFNLIHYIEGSNKDLTNLLLSLREGSFTDVFSSRRKGKGFADMSEALNEVTQQFAKVNFEKELQYQYLQAMNENIGVGIISMDEEGKLLTMNPASKKILKITTLTSIEDFKQIDSNLYNVLLNLTPSRRQLVKVFIDDEFLQLSVQMKVIILQKMQIRIYLLQNIGLELEEKEIEAWQQLTRVLTHEIMNSVTPIASLTDAINSILKERDGSPKDLSKLHPENIEDIHSSLSTISTRSKGLMKFVGSYKEFAKTPDLKIEETELVSLVNRIVALLTPDLEKLKIQINVHANGEMQARADTSLIEQVLINIIKNAMEAVPHNGAGTINITLKYPSPYTVSITISDNGHGMNAETMSRIFIPFYTTKSKGTGIGLSLSRQIMKLHNGTIRVHSEEGRGSAFTIEWDHIA